MLPSVVLIVQPQIDFSTLLTLGHKLLGYSMSAKVDQSRLEHSDVERLISCLAAVRDPQAPAGITPNLLHHASYSALICAEERDMTDILAAASGMHFVVADTVMRGALFAFVTGTVTQWRDAVKSGATADAEHNVRHLYCSVMRLFQQQGLGSAWADVNQKPLDDTTFYLEDKRPR